MGTHVKQLDVSVVGELNLDMILYGLPRDLQLEREHLARDMSLTLGSSSAIFAHNLALLDNRVGFTSLIGDDPFGKLCLERLGESGAALDGVCQQSGGQTGVTLLLPSDSRRYILTYPGTMFDMKYDDLDLNFILGARHFHLSSYFLHRALRPRVPDLFREAKKAGLTTSFDTNDDPEDVWAQDVFDVLKYVDVFLPNEREACRIAKTEDLERAASKLAEVVPVLVIKRGKKGAMARLGDQVLLSAPVEVIAVDSAGAGDSFDAGFIHEYIRGKKIEDCLRFGNITGALSTTRTGGTEAFRDRTYRDSFLESHK